MGRYRTLMGMIEGVVMSGEINGVSYQIMQWERPSGSTAGIVYVSVYKRGAGVATEQFSGNRRDLANGLMAIWQGMLVEGCVGDPLVEASARLTLWARRRWAAQKAAATRKANGGSAAPAALAPVASADVADRRRAAALKAAATRRARATQAVG